MHFFAPISYERIHTDENNFQYSLRHILMTKKIDSLFKFRPVTSGERLFQHISNQFMPSDARRQVYQLEYLQIGNRQDDWAEYYIGAYCFNLSARLIKKARHVIGDHGVPEERRSHLMRGYILDEMEVAIGRHNQNSVDRLIELSISAALASNKDISRTVKGLVTPAHKAIYCYICGNGLLHSSPDENVQVEYEHIWPSSLGGDSIEENLLPACQPCNKAKGAMLLWQDAHIHSFVLKPNPSAEALTSIQRKEKIALHRRKIFDKASEGNFTLKDAALRVGSMGPITHPHPNDATDFFNCLV